MTLAISALTALAFAALPMTIANALQQGDAVLVLIPADVQQPNSNSKLIFPGGPSTTIDTTGCGSFPARPQQQAIIVTLGEGATRTPVIVTSEAEPVEAGTQLNNLGLEGACTIGDTTYFRYIGFVIR